MNPFYNYANNVTSQYGEDGIIEEIFARIGTTNKFCVEFGAWDGVYLSNTWNLWHNSDWNGVLIEGDCDKYKDLVDKFGTYENLTMINAYVGRDETTSLDAILSNNNIPSSVDLLSIDIDGDEYYIFESLNIYIPRVVIIEHNPTIPPDISIVQGLGEYFGASALALKELFSAKGYVLVACTETNSIFVIASEFDKLHIDPPRLMDIFPKNNLTYVVTSYDGKTFLSQNPVYAKKIQPVNLLNKLIQKIRYYSSDYNENINFAKSGDLLPVSIYLNGFFYKRTRPLIDIILTKAITILKKLPIIGRILTKLEIMFDEYSIISRWKSAGKPLPPPHIIKRRIILKYGRQFSIKCIVETGTYMGEMIQATLKYFKRIYSIEIDSKLFDAARAKFCDDKKVELFCGDSGEILGELMERIDCQCIFWLDGHYSEGVTGKGALETPIVAEINTILAHEIKNHIILIDDARCFDGTGDYPKLDQFLPFLSDKLPDHNVFVDNDVIQVIPRQ